jgi:hypothetical protein
LQQGLAQLGGQVAFAFDGQQGLAQSEAGWLLAQLTSDMTATVASRVKRRFIDDCILELCFLLKIALVVFRAHGKFSAWCLLFLVWSLNAPANSPT